jgi:hypothetical protein
VALVYARLKDKLRTLQWLNKAYEQRDSSLVDTGTEPALDFLRSDRRFVDLLLASGFHRQASLRPTAPRRKPGNAIHRNFSETRKIGAKKLRRNHFPKRNILWSSMQLATRLCAFRKGSPNRPLTPKFLIDNKRFRRRMWEKVVASGQ